MKRFFGYALIVASLSLPAFAAKNSQDVTLNAPVKVGTTQLPAGNYKAVIKSESNVFIKSLNIIR